MHRAYPFVTAPNDLAPASLSLASMMPASQHAIPATPRELAAVIKSWKDDATVLRRRGDQTSSRLLEQCASEVSVAVEDFVQWMSEEHAAQRAGWTAGEIHRHALAFQHTPYVRSVKRGTYQLCACIVPRRAPLHALRPGATK